MSFLDREKERQIRVKRNLVIDLEKLSGECLASSILRHLMLRSSIIRDAVHKYVANTLCVEGFRCYRKFHCETEWPTFDEEYGKGLYGI